MSDVEVEDEAPGEAGRGQGGAGLGEEPVLAARVETHDPRAASGHAVNHASASSSSANSPQKDSVWTETSVKPALRRRSAPCRPVDHVSSSKLSSAAP